MSRAPNFHLKGMNKITGDRSQKIGAAWSNEDGSITLVLDMFVTIQANSDMVYTLFPCDDVADPHKRVKKAAKADHPTLPTQGSTWHP